MYSKKKGKVLHPWHVLRGHSTHSDCFKKLPQSYTRHYPTFFTGGEALLLTSVLILMCKISDVLHPTVKFPL